MKKIIHIDQHALKRNRKTGGREAPITVKTYKSNERAHGLEFCDKNGVVIGGLFYDPDNPLPCGATVWIEFIGEVRPLPKAGRPARAAAVAPKRRRPAACRRACPAG